MLTFDKLSYWEKNIYLTDIDYLIIGSGIVGLSTALELRLRDSNAKIIILERGYLPTGASTKNAGFTCFGSPSEILDDISNFGIENIKETILLRWRGLETLKSSELKKVKIYYPKDCQEQQKIASCLSSLDELIAAANGAGGKDNISCVLLALEPAVALAGESRIGRFLAGLRKGKVTHL